MNLNDLFYIKNKFNHFLKTVKAAGLSPRTTDFAIFLMALELLG